MKYSVQLISFLILYFNVSLTATAGSNHLMQVRQLIDKDEAPEGVVIEIVNKDQKFLDWALPEAEMLANMLRNKYPGLDIAVVSHGSEQFALTRKQLSTNTSLSDALKSIVSSDVQLHVCGTLAERKGIEVEEFSELVDIAAEGPAQINDYIKLGFVRIKIKKY